MKEKIFSDMFSFEDLMSEAQNRQDRCRNGLKMSQHKDKTLNRVISHNVTDIESDIKTLEKHSKQIFNKVNDEHKTAKDYLSSAQCIGLWGKRDAARRPKTSSKRRVIF